MGYLIDAWGTNGGESQCSYEMSLIFGPSRPFVSHGLVLRVTGTFNKLAQRSNPKTRRMVILCKLPENTSLFQTVESLVIGLMGSYHDVRTGPTLSESEIMQWTVVANNARLMTGICNNVFKQTGWTAACSRLSLCGVNITTPFSEHLEHGPEDRTPWVRQDGPGFGTFRRSESRIQHEYDKNQYYLVLCRKTNRSGYYRLTVPTDLIKTEDTLKKIGAVLLYHIVIVDRNEYAHCNVTWHALLRCPRTKRTFKSLE